MNNNRKKDLHHRYLKRTLSEQELEEFFAMIDQGDSSDMEDFYEVAKEFPTQWEPKGNIAKDILRKQHANRFSSIIIKKTAAAMIAVTVLFGGYKGYEYYHFKQTQPSVEYSVIRNPYGKRSKIILPDQSVVYLNSGSSIRFKTSFTETKREVSLEGEACFYVIHNSKKPFVVKSGNISTVVLGTSFDVKAYKNEKQILVTVKSGKVGVMRNNEKKISFLSYLTPGEQLAVNNQANTYSKKNIDTETIMAWTENRMVFYDASLQEITVEMERWYNVKIKLSHPIKGFCKFSFTLDNQSLNTAMMLLSQLSGVKYQIKGNTVHIDNHNCR